MLCGCEESVRWAHHELTEATVRYREEKARNEKERGGGRLFILNNVSQEEGHARKREDLDSERAKCLYYSVAAKNKNGKHR